MHVPPLDPGLNKSFIKQFEGQMGNLNMAWVLDDIKNCC